MNSSVWMEKRPRKKGTTWLVCHEIDGKRQPAKSFRIRTVADDYAAKLRKRLEQTRAGLPVSTEAPTISALRDLYLASKPRKLEKTRRDDRTAIGHAIKRFGNVPIDMVGRDAVEAWRTDLVAEGRKAGGVNWILRVNRALWNFAMRRHPPLATFNPFAVEFLPEEFRSRALSDAELDSLFSRYPKSALAPTMWALLTGMRRGEVVKLDKSDLRCFVSPNRTQWAAYLGKTKNGKDRWVPIPGRAMSLIREPKAGERGQVFEGLKRDWLTNAFTRARARARLSGVTFHMLRHTWATKMGARLPWATLKAFGGWKTDFAASRYQHPGVEVLAMVEDVAYNLPTISPLTTFLPIGDKVKSAAN